MHDSSFAGSIKASDQYDLILEASNSIIINNTDKIDASKTNLLIQDISAHILDISGN